MATKEKGAPAVTTQGPDRIKLNADIPIEPSLAAQEAMIAFTIPGEPVAFARSGGKGKIRFTPKRQRDFMALAQLAAHRAMNGQPPLEGPIELPIRATYRVPASWSKKRADAARWRTSRPDADNIAKIVADSINEIVFGDDSQVANLVVQKAYGPIAGVTVSAMALGGSP